MAKKKELSAFDEYQLKIARKILTYTDAGARMTGGMTKSEARDFISKMKREGKI